MRAVGHLRLSAVGILPWGFMVYSFEHSVSVVSTLNFSWSNYGNPCTPVNVDWIEEAIGSPTTVWSAFFD